jgi:hypothetical protein
VFSDVAGMSATAYMTLMRLATGETAILDAPYAGAWRCGRVPWKTVVMPASVAVAAIAETLTIARPASRAKRPRPSS